ncbi:MAG: toprim domain-containing protein [Pseudomonadota bacterium]
MSTLHEWARALGGEVCGRQILCPGPGHSVRDRSLVVWQSADALGGFTTHSHAGDAFELCRDHVAERIGAPRFGTPSRLPIRTETLHKKVSEQTNGDIAQLLWRKAESVCGSLAERYLREERGLRCALPQTMRFLPARGRNSPALITAFAIPDEPQPGLMLVDNDAVRAVHLTSLTPHGQKTGKRFLGSPAGLPLAVSPWTDSNALVVTEGIEDALSVHEATGLAAWAAGSAAHMAKLADAIPAFVETVTIIEDGNEAGRRGTGALADALRARRIETIILGGARG